MVDIYRKIKINVKKVQHSRHTLRVHGELSTKKRLDGATGFDRHEMT